MHWCMMHVAAARRTPQTANKLPALFMPSLEKDSLLHNPAPPLISVIVRSNGRETLDEALASVAAQSWRPIELVLVDITGRKALDGCTIPDGLEVQILSTGQPLGRGAAANAGLEAARGDWLIFLDDDDWFLPHHLAALMEALTQRPEARAAYAGVECRTLEPSGAWTQGHIFNAAHDPIRLLVENYLPIHAVLFHRSCLGEARFDERLEIYEDWDFWIQLSALTDFVHVDRIGAIYRIASEGGLGARPDDPRITQGLAAFFSKWRERWSLDQVLAITHYAKHRSMYQELRLHGEREAERLRETLTELDQARAELAAAKAEEGRLWQQISELHDKVLASDQQWRNDRQVLDALGVYALTDAQRLREEARRYRIIHRALSPAASLVRALRRATGWPPRFQYGGGGLGRPDARAHREAQPCVLVIDAVMLTPDQDSGSLRMANLLQTFQQLGWHVSFAPSNLDFHPPYGQRLEEQGIEVLHAGAVDSIVDFLRLHGRDLDLVILSRHYVAASFLDAVRQHAPQAQVWFDTVDLHFLREQREAELHGDERARRQAEQSRRQELELMRRTDLTLVVSQTERELLEQEAPGVRVEILSNIHDANPTTTPFAERDAIVFIGGFNHPPNVDAMQYYVRDILPLVRAELGVVPTFIIGSRPPPEILALENAAQGVLVTGHIQDVMPYFARARLSIAPLRYGAGVKGKINMSMALGVPVVATPCAAEGMHLVEGDDILLGADATTFAAAMVRLYRDRDLWETLVRNGLRNIDTHFSRQTARATLERLLAESSATQS